MEHYYEFGGVTVRVTAPAGLIDTASIYLAPFAVKPSAQAYHMFVELAHTLEIPQAEPVYRDPERRIYPHEGGAITLVGPENAPYMRMERSGDVSRVNIIQYGQSKPVSGKQLLMAMEAEHLIVHNDGILLHSSFICHQGEAILFTAPSGTGKSTQAELWQNLRGAKVINGDRSVVKKGSGGRFEALGVPFCGSSGICMPARLPLKAIVVLSQAPENVISPITGIRAFRAIWEGCAFHTWNRADVSRCSQTVADLVSQVPIYHLACTPDVRAVEILESVLYK